MAREQCEKRAKTVVVVGAGAAGLQAANFLMQSDAFLDGHIDVIILEARDRTGGRIYTDKRWGFPIDHGSRRYINILILRSKLDSWNISESTSSSC
jgi:protoporphyrinogen oxidase